MNKEKDRKKIGLPGVVFATFVAAMATFFILLQIEKNALSAYEKITVWAAKCELADGLEIREQGWEDYFEEIEIDKNKVPEEWVEELSDLTGMRTAIRIPRGSILTDSMFTGEDAYVSHLQNPIIVGCKSEDLFQVVSGVLRKGDMVHIYTVNEELGETYLLWENVMVYQTFDTAGNSISSQDTATPAARVNLLLEEDYAEQFYHELDHGSLRVVKVWE